MSWVFRLGTKGLILVQSILKIVANDKTLQKKVQVIDLHSGLSLGVKAVVIKFWEVQRILSFGGYSVSQVIILPRIVK